MAKQVTYAPQALIRIRADGTGPRSGSVEFEASNGAIEPASIGAGAGFDINFSTLGTAAQRTAFVALLNLIIAAGRTHIGDV